jgi:hypothetical protein
MEYLPLFIIHVPDHLLVDPFGKQGTEKLIGIKFNTRIQGTIDNLGHQTLIIDQ